MEVDERTQILIKLLKRTHIDVPLALEDGLLQVADVHAQVSVE